MKYFNQFIVFIDFIGEYRYSGRPIPKNSPKNYLRFISFKGIKIDVLGLVKKEMQYAPVIACCFFSDSIWFAGCTGHG
jgi:hypothetical protein